MADKEKIKAWAKENSSMLYLGGMALLAVLAGVMVYVVEGMLPPIQEPEIATAELTIKIADDGEDYRKVESLIKPPVDFEDTAANGSTGGLVELSKRNMFDPKAAAGAEQLVEEANSDFEDAYRFWLNVQRASNASVAVKRQTLQSALSKVEEALAKNRAHQRARALREDIRNALAALAASENAEN